MKRIKILLINPPVWLFVGHNMSNSPVLGIGYIGAVLDKAGYDVSIIDADALGLDREALEQRVRDEDPDIVGVTSTTLGLPVMHETIRIAKKAKPTVKVMVGGPGPTLEPEKVLRDNADIDVAALDEAEEFVVDLVRSLEGAIPMADVGGLAYLDGDQYVQTHKMPVPADLDRIPQPAYHLMDPPFLAYHGVHGSWPGIELPNAVLMASRGCPHRCTFCSQALTKVRRRSPKDIVDEIEYCHRELGAKSVQLYDPEFLGMSHAQNVWISEICDEIIRRDLQHLGKLVQGRCSKFVTDEVLEKMKAAGFKWIWFGVESGSEKVLKAIQKDETVPDIVATFKKVRKHGIQRLMFLMVGLPEETPEDVVATGRLVEASKPDRVRVHIATPLPGTKMYDQLQERIIHYDYSLYDTRLTVVHSTETMDADTIKRMYEWLHFKYEVGYWYFAKLFFKSLLDPKELAKTPTRVKKVLDHSLMKMRGSAAL